MNNNTGTRRFEYKDDKPADARAKVCNAFEVMDGKKTVATGSCPEAGMLGRCAVKIGNATQDRPCYGAVEACEKSCKADGGSFTKK